MHIVRTEIVFSPSVFRPILSYKDASVVGSLAFPGS